MSVHTDLSAYVSALHTIFSIFIVIQIYVYKYVKYFKVPLEFVMHLFFVWFAMW